jgi:hypothetical protein
MFDEFSDKASMQAGEVAQLREIDRPREFPRRRNGNKVGGPILTAALVAAAVGAVVTFLFLETKDGRLAGRVPSLKGAPQIVPSHG